MTRIDPATGQPSGPMPVGAGPAGIAVTPAAVWVANSLDLTVSRLDPATGRVTATIGVGDGPGAIAAASDGVWVSDEFDATLDRIDPHTNQVSRVVSVGSTPQGIAAAGSGVWVAARPFAAASHRGGTLTEVSSYLPQPDPAHDYDTRNACTRRRLRRAGRVPQSRRRAGGHARAGPGRYAAAAGRRRHDVHVHAAPGNPVLQRRARAGVRLPPRHPAPAQLRRCSRLLRGHPRRASVPPEPAAVRPGGRDRHR